MYDEPAPDGEGTMGDWFEQRVLELIYTAKDMGELARSLNDMGKPYRWNEERREMLRAEVEAAMFYLYGLKRDDVDYIMDTFSVVRREEEAIHGTYRTKDRILDAYDRMAEVRATGGAYQTLLDPPPGKGPRHPA
jgi:CRISPR/Cas system-associated endonuclease Cas3-HD